MKAILFSAPSVEPISLAELKLHLRIDSVDLSDNVTASQSIAPGLHEVRELLTLDVAPGGAGWIIGDTITGTTSTKSCVIVEIITTKIYVIKSRSGAFILGEILTNGTDTADQGAANPVVSDGYYHYGSSVEVLGLQTSVILDAGLCGTGGKIDVKIQESDDNTTFTDWTGGAFTQVTETTDLDTFQKDYTGGKRYIRAVAKVLVASCAFGVSIFTKEGSSAEDSLLTDLIVTARLGVEEDSGRKLINQTWDYYPQGWPHGAKLKIPFGNLQSVTSVAYTDNSGTTVTLTENTDYIVEKHGNQCGFLVLPYGVVWPTASLNTADPIKIRFVCGYGATGSDVSAIAKTAIKFLCAKMYENRGEDYVGVSAQEDKTYDRLVNMIPRLYDRDFL